MKERKITSVERDKEKQSSHLSFGSVENVDDIGGISSYRLLDVLLDGESAVHLLQRLVRPAEKLITFRPGANPPHLGISGGKAALSIHGRNSRNAAQYTCTTLTVRKVQFSMVQYKQFY